MKGVMVNFSDVESFETLPPGVYRAFVDGAIIKESEQSDYNYINWEFKLRDHPGKQWAITSFSPRALWKLKEVLMAVGESEDAFAGEFEINDTYLEQFIGVEVDLILTTEPYQGRQTNRVDKVVPVITTHAAAAVRRPVKKTSPGRTVR